MFKDVSRTQAAHLYRIIEQRLRNDEHGQDILSQFAKSPKRKKQILINYLRERLPEDPELEAELAAALSKNQNVQFHTSISGGMIEEIVNVATVGVMHIQPQVFLFRDLKQLALTLAFLVLTVVGVAVFRWWQSQPIPMHGGFNISVAQFGEVTADGLRSTETASIIAKSLFNYLDAELGMDKYGVDVDVSHDRLPIVSGQTEAAELAQKINADVVIYGDIMKKGETEAELTPRFYIAGDPSTVELTGMDGLSAPISFDLSNISHDQASLESLRSRAAVLIATTKGLILLQAGEYKLADGELNTALRLADALPSFDGKDLIHILAGTTKRLLNDYEGALVHADAAKQLNPQDNRADLAAAAAYTDLAASIDAPRDALHKAVESLKQCATSAGDASVQDLCSKELTTISMREVLAETTKATETAKNAETAATADVAASSVNDENPVETSDPLTAAGPLSSSVASVNTTTTGIMNASAAEFSPPLVPGNPKLSSNEKQKPQHRIITDPPPPPPGVPGINNSFVITKTPSVTNTDDLSVSNALLAPILPLSDTTSLSDIVASQLISDMVIFISDAVITSTEMITSVSSLFDLPTPTPDTLVITDTVPGATATPAETLISVETTLPTDTPTPVDTPTDSPTPVGEPTNTPVPVDAQTDTPTLVDIPTDPSQSGDTPTDTPAPVDAPADPPAPADAPTDTSASDEPVSTSPGEDSSQQNTPESPPTDSGATPQS